MKRAFNRTIVELKSGFEVCYNIAPLAFNRTIVELKYKWDVIYTETTQTFNRTIVELKSLPLLCPALPSTLLIVP